MSGPSLAARLARIEQRLQVVAESDALTHAEIVAAAYAELGLPCARPLPRSLTAGRVPLADLIVATGNPELQP